MSGGSTPPDRGLWNPRDLTVPVQNRRIHRWRTRAQQNLWDARAMNVEYHGFADMPFCRLNVVT